MKRWTAILGKAGIVFIHAGLILLLFSFISQLLTFGSNGSGSLSQGEIKTAGSSLQLCPLQELDVTVAVEEGGFLTVYLLETDNDFYYNALRLDWTDNSTAFQEFLTDHPDQIIWEDRVENRYYNRGLFSTRFMDATVVFYNPTQEIAYFNYKRDVNLLGPVDTTRTIALYATPLGILLALPWQINVWNKKKHKNSVFEPANNIC